MANERDLYKPIIQGARHEGALLCRIHDSAYTGKKPFDMFGVLPDGRALAVEVKDAQRFVTDPARLLEAHQLAWLRQWAERGGAALLLVHCNGVVAAYLMASNGDLRARPALVKAQDRWCGIVRASSPV